MTEEAEIATLARAFAASLDALGQQTRVFVVALEKQVAKLQAERDVGKEQDIEREKKECPQADIATLNVGGTLFTTYRSTLVKHDGSMLAAMFSGRYPLVKDANGNPFIDRSPATFSLILDWLRSDKMLLDESMSATAKQRLDDDLNYFGLKDFVHAGQSSDSSSILAAPPFVLLTPEQSLALWTMLGKLPADVSKARCLFQASKDGFAAAAFHAKVRRPWQHGDHRALKRWLALWRLHATAMGEQRWLGAGRDQHLLPVLTFQRSRSTACAHQAAHQTGKQ